MENFDLPNTLHSHHGEPVVPLVLPNENKVVTFCEFCFVIWGFFVIALELAVAGGLL